MKFDKTDLFLIAVGIALIFLTPGAPDEAIPFGIEILRKVILR